MNYEFLIPARIVFGWGRRQEVGACAAALGRRAVVVSGGRRLAELGHLAELLDSLDAAGVKAFPLPSQAREPSLEDVDAAVESARSISGGPVDLVVAMGGGSALDLGKAVAALVPQSPGSCARDYVEGFGTPQVLSQPPLPLVALPTTGGTGSEATKNAVLSCASPVGKRSLRDPRLVPRVALVDPELSVSFPRLPTLWTGLDAITQLIESYISRRANPVPQALAEDGLRRAWQWLPIAVANGQDRAARENMAHAALVSGMALANSGLGFAHGVAAALGALANVPHGLACAALLPAALTINRTACEETLAQLARRTLPNCPAGQTAAVDALERQVRDLLEMGGITGRLRDLGVLPEQLPELARLSRGNSLAGNPRALGDDELLNLLESLW